MHLSQQPWRIPGFRRSGLFHSLQLQPGDQQHHLQEMKMFGGSERSWSQKFSHFLIIIMWLFITNCLSCLHYCIIPNINIIVNSTIFIAFHLGLRPGASFHVCIWWEKDKTWVTFHYFITDVINLHTRRCHRNLESRTKVSTVKDPPTLDSRMGSPMPTAI